MLTNTNDFPSAYAKGYEKACAVNRTAAEKYMKHTRIGDPELDPILEELVSLPTKDWGKYVEAGIEQKSEILKTAPEPLRNFFRDIEEPEWLNLESFLPAVRAFHLNADFILAAFVTGVLVEGFSTLIAKSFNMTGRVFATEKRLKQNNRQLVEIFFPGGLNRMGDGWKLSVRVRFVHGRIRSLLSQHDTWRFDEWGVPLSAAHLGLANSIFSKRMLDYATLLGAKFTKEDRQSVLDVWRYTGYLMGVPESILYTTAAEADEIYRIGFLCEPPPSEDSVIMANALIGAIPAVANIRDEAEIKKVLKQVYQLSRSLIGNRLADDFQYPKTSSVGPLLLFRVKQRVQRLLVTAHMQRSKNFHQLLEVSAYDKLGLKYDLPDQVEHEKSTPW